MNVFEVVQQYRSKQEGDVALLAWLHEERWWKFEQAQKTDTAPPMEGT